MATLITSIQHSIGSPSYSNQRRKYKIKNAQIGRDEVKLSLYADDMILYIENPKNARQKLLELINEKQSDKTKLTYRNWLHFLTLTTKYQKGNIKNTHFRSSHCGAVVNESY